MKKRIHSALIFLCLGCACLAILNMNVTTRVGVDYKLQVINLPLYLKVLNFFDRHYNYVWLTRRIIGNLEKDDEKAIKLLKWTFGNIKPQPKSLPVMDEHVWSVIVRGYGVSSNVHDVFSTLCNYADMDAYFTSFPFMENGYGQDMSLVLINGSWTAFDPYNGVYFRNKSENIASIQDMKAGDMKIIQLSNKFSDRFLVKKDYMALQKFLPDTISLRFTRANIQSPVNRLLYQFTRWGESWGVK